MTYAEYDTSVLPFLSYPLNNSQETTKKYLGGRAMTGEEYATLSFNMVDDTKAEALYSFWRDDCNYGTDAFLIAMPFRGVVSLPDIPNVLCKFVEDVSMDKVALNWTQAIRVKVLEYSYVMGNIADDSLNQLVDDSGNILVSTSTPVSNSNKEITYG